MRPATRALMAGDLVDLAGRNPTLSTGTIIYSRLKLSMYDYFIFLWTDAVRKQKSKK
jgi:hypothetical protein